MTGTSTTVVWYTPGPWIAVVGPACVLALETSVETPLFQAWAEAAAAGAGADDLLRLASNLGVDGVPSFAVVEPRADGLRVVLHGAARVWCADGQELTAAEPWRDGVVPQSVLPARIGGPVPAVGPRLPLILGAAFCSALDLYPSPEPDPEPEPALAAAPVAPPATLAAPAAVAPVVPTPAPLAPPSGVIDAMPWQPDPGPAEPLAAPSTPPTAPAAPTSGSRPWTPSAAAIDEVVTSPTTPVAEMWPATAEEPTTEAALPYDPQDVTVARSSLPTSGPTVVAVRCPAGHLSPAHAPVCRVCDLPIGSDQQPATVGRPTLGLLRLPSGQTITLDRGVVLGRAPSARDTGTGEQQHVVSLASPDKDISRNHLEIRLDGWHVLAVDLGSVNGTVVTLPGRATQRLRPDEPVLLERGATVTLADDVTVTFEVPA